MMKNENGKILIVGGTGMVGSIIKNYLEAKGKEVYILSRKEKKMTRMLSWDPLEETIDPRIKDHRFETVINATGAGIAEKRWTKERKKILRDSRIQPIQYLWKLIRDGQLHTQSFITICAIGIYGNREEPVNELDPPAVEEDFMVRLSKDWEAAFRKNSVEGVYSTILRLGVVISSKGGFIEPFLFPIRIMAAPYFGSGSNYISWIHEDDLAAAIYAIIEEEDREMVYNITTPVPVTSAQFSKELKKVFNPWAIRFPVPGWALGIIFGEMKSAILSDARVMPFHLNEMDYHFEVPEIHEALLRVKAGLRG